MSRFSEILLINGSLVRAQQAEPNCDVEEGVAAMWPLFLCPGSGPGACDGESVGHLDKALLSVGAAITVDGVVHRG